jgi:hypothetical protein
MISARCAYEKNEAGLPVTCAVFEVGPKEAVLAWVNEQ